MTEKEHKQEFLEMLEEEILDEELEEFIKEITFTEMKDEGSKKYLSEFWAKNPTKEEILAKLEETGGEILIGAPSELLSDREFMLKAVDECGFALEYASDELKNDEEVVLTAIQGWDGVSVNYSYAIKEASEELRSNKEFMRKAIELTEGEAFCGATDELKNDKEFVLFAVRHGSPPHQCDPDIVLRYASEEMRADKDVVLAAVRKNGWSLYYASEELKADKDVVLVATINNSWSLTYASPTLRENKDFIIELVKRAGDYALHYVDEALQNDADVLEAVKRYIPLDEDCGFEYYGLNKIIIPSTVTHIDIYELSSPKKIKKNIESITVEEGNSLYHSAGNCLIATESKLLILGCKNSVIPDDGSVEVICDGAFADCEGLKSIHIPASIKMFSVAPFGGVEGDCTCSDLERITVSPDNKNYYSINDEVLICKDEQYVLFAGKNIKDFTFPANISWIAPGAFSACRDLESLNVDPENPYLYSINNCVVDRESRRILLGCKNSIIPDDGTIESIVCGAFSGVELKNIYIPSSVIEIEPNRYEYPFDGCIGIESITVSDDNEIYCGINNCLVERDFGSLIRGCKNSLIPNDGSVTQIGDFAFADCTELVSISIPSSVKTICFHAFHNCDNLTTVVLGNGIENLGYKVFNNCDKLSYIFYCGTQSEWEQVFFEYQYNMGNFESKIYYYSEEKPTEDGNYWHYVDGEPTVW